MLDPRIYRAGFVPVALAVIALAFSLSDQPGQVGTNLAPDAFNGQNAFNTMTTLASQYPNRRPGSTGDEALADYVAQQLKSQQLARSGFIVSRNLFTARTADGTRTLDTVTAVRTGLSNRRIVVVTHRDALSPTASDLSGTATLLQLAHVLSGRTLNRTIVLASISGSAGEAGATQLAGALGGPVDAVIVLGDLASTQIRAPIVVPWSGGQAVAPPMLRNTVAAALGAQAGLPPGGTSLAGQFARLALPLSISEQAPFGALGEPAVLLSASGERGPRPGTTVSQDRLTGFGRAALQTISALDGAPAVSAPTAYLLYDRKMIPAWAIRLLVLALFMPVLGATIDGFARARRRGHVIGMSIVRVLASAVPFLLAALLVIALRTTGLLKVAPPGPVGAGVVPLHSAGVAILIGACCVLLLAAVGVRRIVAPLGAADPPLGDSGAKRGIRGPASAGGAVAMLLVLCAISLAVWVVNPFAAGLLVLPMHLWMWAVAPGLQIRTPVKLALILIGIAPIALVLVYYAVSFGLGPIDVAWTAVMALAGQPLGDLTTVVAWSIVLGCATSAAVIAANAARENRPEDAPVTVRGPVTYAGPGSLGGTESALRR
jgi:hypothetical protein